MPVVLADTTQLTPSGGLRVGENRFCEFNRLGAALADIPERLPTIGRDIPSPSPFKFSQYAGVAKRHRAGRYTGPAPHNSLNRQCGLCVGDGQMQQIISQFKSTVRAHQPVMPTTTRRFSGRFSF